MPFVSVILPVYNAERFIKEAIDSILNQTFQDFELIIINDGSTDNSDQIITSFNDPRIVYLKNMKNSGLIYTLNKGITVAKGKYIARMDSDDISMPDRLLKQVSYLNTHNNLVVASTVKMIDIDGIELPDWKEDLQCLTPYQIRKFLPKDNCIAHPSVMIEASLLKKYRYNSTQIEAEDYDLWLRLTADKINIHKISEPLLYYRFLENSLSRKEKLNAFERLSRTKLKFAKSAFKKKKVNNFVLRVFINGTIDKLKSFIKQKLVF